VFQYVQKNHYNRYLIESAPRPYTEPEPTCGTYTTVLSGIFYYNSTRKGKILQEKHS